MDCECNCADEDTCCGERGSHIKPLEREEW